ncbi:MAG: ABC transporter permease [Bacteroidales bacterium]|nr:ABC transporter permease [Bacteroidales bacterium]
MKIFLRSLRLLASRPIYWGAIFAVPLFIMLLLSSLMQNGIPSQVPSAVVDMDGSAMSRRLTNNLASMQMIDMQNNFGSYSEAKDAVQRGEIFGFFLIPEHYQSDLLGGKAPVISYYTNMSFYISGTMTYKAFTTMALMNKAGTVVSLAQSVGVDPGLATAMIQPVAIQTRGIGNPGTSYAIYLATSFVPCAIQLMIMLTVCFSMGQEIKRRTGPRLMAMAGDSPLRAVFLTILPQTLIWFVIIMFMESWFFRWEGYPMHGSWLWITVSELLFVLACQGFALFIFGLLPNLRLSLSACSLLGMLSFSLAALSFPEQSMYIPIRMLSFLTPIRYNFLIYSDIALNGRELFFSRWYFIMYIAYILAPLLTIRRIGSAFRKPVYVP